MTTTPVRICVPVNVQRADELKNSIRQAAEVADIIELRMDYLPLDQQHQALRELPSLVAGANRPFILTLRPLEQGGRADLNLKDRIEFWSQIQMIPRAYLDLELDLVLRLTQEKSIDEIAIDWSRTICSHHDFAGLPSDLQNIYDRMAATPARILKIAFQAEDAIDCLPAFHLLKRAQREGREMISIAMGESGIVTRILAPSRGAFLTFGSLDDQAATAPGQITARHLKDVYRIDQLNRQSEIFGLMGRPVSHSISPHIHNAAFAASQLNAVYVPFEVRDAVAFLRRMIHPRTRELDWNMQGLSITAPHKRALMGCLDWIEPSTKEIGAVNTIVVQNDELHGYNTDVTGFILPLKETYGALKNARCAVIGAGGAARAALSALHKEEAEVEMFVRNPESAKALAEEFGVDRYSLGEANFNGFDIVINATPLGTSGRQVTETPARAEQLRNVRLAYDLVYNPEETRFLREARAAGCNTIGGLEMLIAQAFEQFKLWTGKVPDLQVMRGAALKGLARQSTMQTATSNF